MGGRVGGRPFLWVGKWEEVGAATRPGPREVAPQQGSCPGDDLWLTWGLGHLLPQARPALLSLGARDCSRSSPLHSTRFAKLCTPPVVKEAPAGGLRPRPGPVCLWLARQGKLLTTGERGVAEAQLHGRQVCAVGEPASHSEPQQNLTGTGRVPEDP